MLAHDEYGYGRNPAFCFTLNCPYNYLYEIHRFQPTPDCLDPTSATAKRLRFQWCLDNPDIVCFLHAVRVELLIRMVMPAILPNTWERPFQFWARFEEGTNGNPHAHGLAYAARNQEFEPVFASEAARQAQIATGDATAANKSTWAEAEASVAKFFSELESESHPAKDAAGEPLYEFIIENLQHPELARPQTVNLKALLDEVFSSDTPDLQPLKRVLVALIEDGQRHTFHQHGPPVKGVHPCARQKPHSSSAHDVF